MAAETIWDGKTMDLSEFIVQFCIDNNVSKDRLAKSADMSRSTLYRILDESRRPTLTNLIKLAIAMQVHPQYLIQLEWQSHKLKLGNAKPVAPLTEPERWFHCQQDQSQFISETVPDGSIVCVGERFSKTWRIQNTGATIWKNRRLECQNMKELINKESKLQNMTQGYNFHITPVCNCVSIPTTPPGETVDLTVEFIAPEIPAQVFSYWKMVNAEGKLCYPDNLGVYLQIQVVSAGMFTKLPINSHNAQHS